MCTIPEFKTRKQTQTGIKIKSYYAQETLLEEHLSKPYIFLTAIFFDS